MLNSSRVADYHSPAGANRAPYPRPDTGISWPVSITGNCPGSGSPQASCVAGSKKCGPWRAWGEDAYDERSTAAGGVGCVGATVVTEVLNCFAAGGTPHDYSRCRKLGWKAVRAQRAWQGVHGMLSHDPSWRLDWQADIYGCTDLGTECGRFGFENAHTTPEANKYLSASTTGYTEHVCVDPSPPPDPGDTWASYAVSASVNPQTGVVTRDSVSWDSSQPDPTAPGFYFWADGSTLLSMQSLAGTMILNGPDGLGQMHGYIAVWSSFVYGASGGISPGRDETLGQNWYCDISGNTRTFYWYDWTISSWEVIGAFTYDPGTGSLNLSSRISKQGGWPGGDAYATLVISSGNTSYTATEVDHYASSYWYTDTTTITGTLSNANNISDVYADARDALLGTWDLADDVTYPWRTDGITHIVPTVGRRETQTSWVDKTPIARSPLDGLVIVAGDTANSVAPWTDEAAAYANGDIVGAPLSYYNASLRGCGPCFDWEHVTWGACQGGDGFFATYPVAHGAWSGSPPGDGAAYDRGGTDISDALMPPEATRWTENDTTRWSFPPGWWAILRGDVLYLQKWAQIKLPWKAHNFARPCGEDRLLMDETTVRCVQGAELVGGKWRLSIASATGISTGDYCRVGGLSGSYGVPDGVYRVTKLTATLYELTTASPVMPSPPTAPDISSDPTIIHTDERIIDQ